ncbi:hypothetical protein ABIF65_004995 [Bradyrhizobium japonicum]|uniref:hypothetical protein n=1 Tax=Bradyrhizobium TaxID=374 RepID=UPI000416066D|nr:MULTISPECIES: hypothetical protein [Bradyrhizobium]MBR1003981.1 hypothetical protein [Bradyrhizobium liaoningense]MBR1031230.1 hypothetical protein [Bradyrhizobium liaoningense]MCP1743320.1 hypothetical protein [Bradyrhizobium japonicum]MCP1781667.1 hypothetical protein [Bradyrhizobium japonicum]MCP1861030.1 hypothetical protein [Bradyrhizobium japonicum]
MLFAAIDSGTAKRAASSDAVAPLILTSAIGIIGFLYCVALVSFFDLSLKARDSILFAFGITALPLLTVMAQQFIINQIRPEQSRRQIEAINIWISVSWLVGLTLIAILARLLDLGSEAWTQAARTLLMATLAVHAAALLFFVLHRKASRLPLRLPTEPSALASIGSYSIAAMVLFKVDLAQPYFSPFVRNFVDPPFGDTTKLSTAAGFAGAIVGVICIVYFLESFLLRRRSAALPTLQVGALSLSIALTFIAYFDFSLNLEPIHYLTIAGPAWHLLSGGTLMVDVFSQYGPGPVLIAVLAWLAGPRTLGTLQIAVQLANLAFYAIWLVCLFRMTRWKATASLLGFAAIGVLLACWDYGNGNVNVAPSILGLRHLPTLCMVLSISCLRPPARLSIFTILCTALAGLWSVECLVGTLGIHLLCIAMIDLRARAYKRLFTDGALAASPVVVSIAVLASATLVQSGSLPDYRTYLEFLAAYNPTSTFWSHAADAQFLAWMTILLSVVLVLCECWRGVLYQQAFGPHLSPDELYYKFLPMAALVAVTAAYYAFRSYDYTLLVALLPFAALAIPAVLAAAGRLATAPMPARFLFVIPIFIGVSTLTFCWQAMTRAEAPYSFLLQECRDQGHCTVSALLHTLEDTSRRRVLMERTGSYLSDRYGDNPNTSQLVPDAVKLIQREAGGSSVTALLGETVDSELALMYTGRWQPWPISFAYTDALIPSLAARIIAAPVTLKPGDLVIVRPNIQALQMIEAGILQRIQSEYNLCPIADAQLSVDGYHIAAKGSPCPNR